MDEREEEGGGENERGENHRWIKLGGFFERVWVRSTRERERRERDEDREGVSRVREVGGGFLKRVERVEGGREKGRKRARKAGPVGKERGDVKGATRAPSFLKRRWFP